MVKIWPKNLFFGSFCEFFLYALLHLWITPQDFAKWQILLRYTYICGRFHQYSIWKVVKLKIFKVSSIDSASMKWPLFGFFWPLSPQILFDLAKTLTRGSPIRETYCLKNPSKFWNLAQMECTESLWFWSILGPNLLLENQKYC